MSDFEDIINMLISEANGDGPEAMRRVAETMINRSALRGLSLGDIVRQPKQYTGLKHPGPAAVQAQHDPKVRQTALEMLQLALQPGDPTNGADHYLNPKVANPNWANVLPTTGDYGDHRFFASRAVPQDALANVLSSSSNLFGPRVAPDPAGVTQQIAARGGNVLNSTFGPSGSLSASTQQSIADMFAPKANNVTPHLNRNGSMMDPAAVVFGGDMEKNIFAGGAGSLTPGGGPPATRSVQSVAMPAGRDPIGSMPSRTELAQVFKASPSVASKPAPKVDGIGAMPSSSDLAAMFGAKSTVLGPNGYTVADKGQERLAATPGKRANAMAPGDFAAGGLDPALVRAPPLIQPASQATVARTPKPTYTTQTVANPAYESMKRQIEAGTLSYNGLSRDSVAARAAGQAMVAKLKAQMAATPPRITVKKPVAVVKAPIITPRAAVVQPRQSAPPEITVHAAAAAKPTSAVDQLRSQGYSPSAAYAKANADAAARALAGGKYGASSSSRAGQSLSQSSGQGSFMGSSSEPYVIRANR